MKPSSDKVRRSIFLGLLFLGFLFVFSDVSGELDAAAEFKKALALFKERNYSQAAAVFDSIEKDLPGNLRGEALFMRGQVARAMEKWEEAAFLFSRAAEAYSDLADYAAFYQGEALRMKEEKEKALQVFQNLIQKHPQSLLIPRTQLQMAEILGERGDWAGAFSLCEQVIRTNGNRDAAVQARFLWAQLKEKAEDWQEAARLYQEVWLRHPLHPKAKTARTKFEDLQKEKKILIPKVAPEASFRRTQILYQARLYDTALSEMDQLEGFPARAYPEGYQGEPWVDDFYFQRAMISFWQKKYSQAEEILHLVVQNSRQKETAEKALYWRCRALERLKRGEEVLKLAASFPEIYPGGAYGDRILYLKAQILEERESMEEAIAAYREVAEKFPKGPLVLQSLWKAGWLLFQKEDPEGAIRTWQAFETFRPTSPWSEKALYWRGKALEKSGKPGLAEETFRRLRQEFPAAYHAQLAAGRGVSPATGKGFSPIREVSPNLTPNSPVPPGDFGSLRLTKGKLLARLNLFAEALEELEAVEGNGGTGEEMRLEVSGLFREMGEYHRSNLLVRRHFALPPLGANPSARDRSLYLLAYPLGNPSWINRYAESQNLDPALLCAVILEESRFDPQARSVAGARGLMQIMPGTGKEIAKGLKVRPYGDQKLFDPELNIRFGSWYLARLLEEFGGKTHLAVAAYNAGPKAVRDWLRRFPGLSEDEFVERIPYAETRNYVVKVLTSQQVYRNLYR